MSTARCAPASRCMPRRRPGAAGRHEPRLEIIADGSIHCYGPCAAAPWPAPAATPRRASSAPISAPNSSPSPAYRTFDARHPAVGRPGAAPGPADRLGQPAHLRNQSPSPTEAETNNSEGNIVARVIVVTSGKGGVGKTTTSASISTGLALRAASRPRSSTSTSACATSTSSWAASAAWLRPGQRGQRRSQPAPGPDQGQALREPLRAARPQTRDKDALTEEGVEKVLKDLTTWASTTWSATPRPASSAAR